ncbi:MAG: 50S ribosomal protein L17 [Patescibacteria group bacterium]|jgi:large subunit ribosomal protein L17
MRHRNKTKTLDRPVTQRLLMRRNMAVSLIMHERVVTTEAKAKWLRPFVERLVSRSKSRTVSVRRSLIEILNNTAAGHKLVDVLAERFAQRNGGYLRITKTGTRLGDGASTAVIEFVERMSKTELTKKQPGVNKKIDSKAKEKSHDTKK